MINISSLDFDVLDILNPKILYLKDASVYNPDLEVEQPILQIKMPSGEQLIKNITENFDLAYNSTDLGITTTSIVNALVELPDGIYVIRYSICPNDEMYVENTFLRNIKQLIRYYNMYCKVDLTKCSLNAESNDLTQLKKIKTYIDAAKYKVDFCGDNEAGLALYNYATYLLDQFESDCKCY